ncbi:cytochrome P450 [Schizophyllum fasciatum]
MPFSDSHWIELAAIAGTAAILYANRRYRSLPLPPGPKKWPLVGNLFNMPSGFEWEQYIEWGKELGTDILHLEVLGQSIVVLNSYEACFELLDRRSRLYSSRPTLGLPMEVMKLDYNVALLPYGKHSKVLALHIRLTACYRRARRRLMHGMLHARAAKQYRPLEVKSVHAFLREMLNSGEDSLAPELRHMLSVVILGTAYGIDIQRNDSHVAEAEEAVRLLLEVTMPGKYLVNLVPALKHIPSWFPGAGFQRKAREWRDVIQYVTDRPFLEVKQSMVRVEGVPLMPSFTSLSLEKGVEDEVIRDAAGTLYNAAADTSLITLLNFALAMLDNPEMQRRAQAELDAVLGPLQLPGGAPGHLPEFADEPHLPFITALVRETMRWMPVAPTGVPHAFTGEQPDVYQSYAIPRDAIVLPNIWAMTHDESVYPDPDTFKPERFLDSAGQLDPNVRDPGDIVFGFGRRVCPGRHMAYSSVWITVASTLRVYNIEKAKRPDGSIIEPPRKWTSALVLNPMPYKCLLVPRNEAAKEIIRSTEVNG